MHILKIGHVHGANLTLHFFYLAQVKTILGLFFFLVKRTQEFFKTKLKIFFLLQKILYENIKQNVKFFLVGFAIKKVF